MQGIYSYVPETNHVSSVHSVAAVLYLQSVLHVLLFPSLNMFRTFTSALPTVCVQCPTWLFFFCCYIIIITIITEIICQSCAVSKLQSCYFVHC